MSRAEQTVAGEPRLRVLHQVFYSLRLSPPARPPELNRWAARIYEALTLSHSQPSAEERLFHEI